MTPAPVNTSPATIAYMLGGGNIQAIVGYSILATDSASPVVSFTLPPGVSAGPIAADSTGQVYVLSYGPALMTQVLVFPPNSSGAATPSRTIDINPALGVSAIAVDPNGLLYMVTNPGGAAAAPRPMILVYSATADRAAKPLRTLELTNILLPVYDINADAAGNIYIAGFSADIGAERVIAVFPPSANGPVVPDRIINFGSSFVFGVAVDPAGDIFANVCVGCNNGTDFVIEEFAPGANGAAQPIRTINIPIEAGWTGGNGGPVRLDGAGNIFTSMQLFSELPGDEFQSPVYGFAPTATGNATPTLQIGGPNSCCGYFALN